MFTGNLGSLARIAPTNRDTLFRYIGLVAAEAGIGVQREIEAQPRPGPNI